MRDFSSEEKRVLLITSPCHFMCHFFILVFPAVTMPLVATLDRPLEEVVKLSFPMYLLFGLCSVPVGMIVDRWRAKPMLVIGQYLMGSGMLVAGLFPMPTIMMVALAVVGIGASVYHPTGLALGFNGVFGNMGIASAPLITGVLTWAFGWQMAFVVLGVFGIASGALLSLVPVDEALIPSGERKTGNGGDLAVYFVIICVALMFAGVAYRGNMLLLPAYLELKTTFFRDFISMLSFLKTQGTATLAATVLTSLVLTAGMFGQVFGGKLADRMDLRYAYLLVHGASLPFVLGMAFATNYVLAFCAAAYVFFALGMQPIENSLIAALTPAKWRSTSYAVKFIINFGIGSSAVYIIGPIKHAFALNTVYVFLAGLTFLLVMSIVTLIVASRRLASVRN